MKSVDYIAYGLILVAAVSWSAFLYGYVGLPRLVAMGLSIPLGPATVIGLSYLITEYFRRRND